MAARSSCSRISSISSARAGNRKRSWQASRTFIDVKIADSDESWKKSKIPILQGIKRLIVGNSCEKGLVEDVNDMREIKKGLDAMKKENPNMAEVGARAAFKSYAPAVVAD